ncbi:C1 family peptidase [Amycolatopsis australiensis]|uniref:C1 family peptidase n=1 Tax=Amycolatopsis australiensis TaxID=546364 RepID=UPI000930AED0|nr:C1 family peptidase [Amycolatopsis australiensis]
MDFKKAVGVVAVALAGLSATTAAAAAAEHHHLAHGLGLNLAAARAHHSTAHLAAPQALRAPASYDLSQYAPAPGDQGQVGSCVTWATGYTGYGILTNEQNVDGAPMAPMFIYSQIAKGNDEGTTASVALPMEQNQGIDTKSDYWQGDFDYTTQPDAAERANAAHYRLSGFTELPTSGSSARTAIQNAISQGKPVPIGFQVHQSFMDLDARSASDYSYLPGDQRSDPIVGGHEVTIVGYNSQGVKIENSWGANWGDGGFVTVPWSFFDTGDVMEIHAMGPLAQG